jgi:alkylhydroperoxidase/carboxymuconolactone decarboxylase family protein YurZ
MTDDERLRFARALTDALSAPEEIRDDWGLFIVDTVLPNGVWSRPGLPVRDRSLITIGFPVAVEAMRIAREVFEERDKTGA